MFAKLIEWWMIIKNRVDIGSETCLDNICGVENSLWCVNSSA